MKRPVADVRDACDTKPQPLRLRLGRPRLAPDDRNRDVATVEMNATEEAQMDPTTVISIIAILIVAAIALRVFGSD